MGRKGGLRFARLKQKEAGLPASFFLHEGEGVRLFASFFCGKGERREERKNAKNAETAKKAKNARGAEIAKKGDKAWEAEEMAFDTPIFRKFEWRPRYHAWLFAANFAEWLETCEDVTAALQKAIQSWGECNTLELKYT